MNWDKLPANTIAVQYAKDISIDQQMQVARDLFDVAAKHNMVVVTSVQRSPEPEPEVKVEAIEPPADHFRLVSLNDYQAFVRRYETNPNKHWYRFGQAFYNEMLAPTLRAPGMPEHSDPELFYATDRAKAINIIFDRYIIV